MVMENIAVAIYIIATHILFFFLYFHYSTKWGQNKTI